MGDRFVMKLKCLYCGMGNDVWYAPTCGVYDFKCDNQDIRIEKVNLKTGEVEAVSDSLGKCNKTNFICADFSVKKAEDVTEEDVIQAFEMASNAYHKPTAIKKMAKQYLRGLKKHD